MEFSPDHKCDKHPQESISFFCFNTNECLCIHCLLPGTYKNQDVKNIKKALSYVQLETESVLETLKDKMKNCKLGEEKVHIKSEEIQNLGASVKELIQSNFSELIQKTLWSFLLKIQQITFEALLIFARIASRWLIALRLSFL